MTTHNAIILHGVGTQKPDYADFALKHIPGSLHAKPVCYAPILQRPEKAFEEYAKQKGSKMDFIQRFMAEYSADALAYRNFSDQIFALIDAEVTKMSAGPISFWTHSLGCMIANDYLNARPNVKIERFVTFGCNIGFFEMGAKLQVAPQLQGVDVWHNFFYKRDPLGYALEGITEGAEHVVDTRITRIWYSLSLFFSALTHTDYFKDRHFWSKTVPGVYSAL